MKGIAAEQTDIQNPCAYIHTSSFSTFLTYTAIVVRFIPAGRLKFKCVCLYIREPKTADSNIGGAVGVDLGQAASPIQKYLR